MLHEWILSLMNGMEAWNEKTHLVFEGHGQTGLCTMKLHCIYVLFEENNNSKGQGI